MHPPTTLIMQNQIRRTLFLVHKKAKMKIRNRYDQRKLHLSCLICWLQFVMTKLKSRFSNVRFPTPWLSFDWFVIYFCLGLGRNVLVSRSSSLIQLPWKRYSQTLQNTKLVTQRIINDQAKAEPRLHHRYEVDRVSSLIHQLSYT